jgi:hypothetical protein
MVSQLDLPLGVRRMRWHIVEWLLSELRWPAGQPLCAVEVGVWQGFTSCHLLKKFPELRLSLVDPWEEKDSMVVGPPPTESQRLLTPSTATGYTMTPELRCGG